MRNVLIASLVAAVLWATAPIIHAESEEWETDPGSERFPVTGNALEYLDEGQEGEVSIVAMSVPDEGTHIPIIVRNNASTPLRHGTVVAEVRGRSGELLDVPRGGDIWPFALEPGALGFAELLLTEELLGEAELIATVEGVNETDETWSGVTLTEYVPRDGGGIGTVTNNTSSRLDTFYMRLACFDDEGKLLALLHVSPSQDSLSKGESSPFRVLFAPPEEDCSTFLFLGFGNI